MRWGRLASENYRGVLLPRVLGLALAAGGIASAAAVVTLGRVGRAGAVSCLAALLVAAAGAVDDAIPGGPRGLRGHLRSLAEGRVSTGVLKVVVVGGAAIVTVAAGPARSGLVRVAGVVLVAGATNVWNGLDVRPGRALKFGLLVLIPTVASVGWPLAPFVPGVALAALLVLPVDAGERAMLGDAGANLLGFTVGLACYLTLPGVGVVVAAVVAVALNILAEIVTFSRLIDAVPPIRFLDRLGTGRRA
jgi:UDP-GlcNAc:undecaprenyl-phosphate GlcNAc-1-phosphate transferase